MVRRVEKNSRTALTSHAKIWTSLVTQGLGHQSRCKIFPMLGSTPAGTISVTVEALKRLGASERSLLRAADLKSSDLANPQRPIPDPAYSHLWAQARRACPQATLGLEAGRAVVVGEFGSVDYVCASSETVGAALEHLQSLLHLACPDLHLRLEERERGALECQLENLVHFEEHPLTDSFVVGLILARLERWAGPAGRASLVRFTDARGTAPSEWLRQTRSDVTFNAPRTTLIFSREALTLPLRTADPHLLRLLTQTFPHFVAPHEGCAAKVRRLLGARLGVAETEERVIARLLGLSPRSLQRRLREEGVGFASLLDEVRLGLACHWLGIGTLAFERISERLGYSEPSAFTRAFRRWTGVFGCLLTPRPFGCQRRCPRRLLRVVCAPRARPLGGWIREPQGPTVLLAR